MKDAKEVLEQFYVYVSENGPEKALSELSLRGVRPDTSGPLVKGRYKHQPKSGLKFILLDILSKAKAAS